MILLIFKSFLSWFKTNVVIIKTMCNELTPVNPFILPFLVQDNTILSYSRQNIQPDNKKAMCYL